ncbi:MAG: site-specific integrase [Bacteroidota bacterium]|nr:site-specific integrase [Bacteroidota bacterium]
MATGSIIIFPNEQKTSKRNGKIPMYVRINWNKKKVETRLLIELTTAEFLKWNPRTMRFDERNSVANETIQNLENKFNKMLVKYSVSPMSVNPSDLRDELLELNHKKHNTIYSYCLNYYTNTVMTNTNIAIGTKKNYLKALKHIEKFLEISNQKELKLSELNVIFANNFWDYLLSPNIELNKSGMTEVSASSNIKRLRTIFDRAYNEELISRNPFKTLKLKSKSPKKDKLNSVDVHQLYHLDLTDHPSLQKVKDIFLFSLFTGLAYKDAMLVKRNQLQEWPNKELFLNLSRVKTDVDSKQFLVSYIKENIEKYKDVPEVAKSGGLIPRTSNQQMNMRLKIIAERVGLTINLTSHIARHSYRQLLSEAGISEIAVIKTMMGHSRNNDIDSVYYNVSEKNLLEAKKKFEKYLKQILKK